MLSLFSNECVAVQIIMIFGITYTYVKRIDVSSHGLFIILIFFISRLVFIFTAHYLMGSWYEVIGIVLQQVLRVIHACTPRLLLMQVEIHVGEI